MSANNNHDNKSIEYKIFKISNDNDDYYISYTTQKYLTRAMENYRRKQTDTFKRLFNGSCVKIELLELIITKNIYFVKNKINEYISKEEHKHNVKVKVEVEVEVCEEAESTTDDNESTTESTDESTTEPATNPSDIECKACNCIVGYKNWSRHRKTKKHLKNCE
tara:strand:- start:1314 stop:1805 length:492 start_codon:yes stop_codon:yes gene_type:complete